MIGPQRHVVDDSHVLTRLRIDQEAMAVSKPVLSLEFHPCKVGLDLGITQEVNLAWAVFAPTGRIGPGDLLGNYAGVSGSASLGVGLGANALLGGSNNSVALQPLSVQGQVGFNVQAGLEGLELRRDR